MKVPGIPNSPSRREHLAIESMFGLTVHKVKHIGSKKPGINVAKSKMKMTATTVELEKPHHYSITDQYFKI